MRIFHLSLANLRKGKSATFSLLVLICVASLLLNIGTAIATRMSSFYEDKAEELHDAHVSLVMNSANYKKSYGDYIRFYPGVEEAEMERVILLPTAMLRLNQSDFSIRTAVLNADSVRGIAPLISGGETASGTSGGIYIPHNLKASGYRQGDPFTLTYRNKTYTYPVAGFFESTLMGTTKMAMLKFYLPDNAYRQLSTALGPEAEGILLSAVFENSADSGTLLRDYNKQFPLSNESVDPGFWGADLETAKSSSALIITIIAMIMVAFAAILVLVSLTVIKFRITDHINDEMVNIGVLKAMGYTSAQILASIVLQFLLIAIAGSTAGVACSYAAMPAFSGVISSLAGLLWTHGAHFGTDLGSVGIVVLLVLAVGLLSSRRIRKLHPAEALRGGLMTHNFRRNHLPLDKAKGSLQLVLACKTMLANSRQNLMLGSIITAITFASVFSVVLYYNIAVEQKAFYQMVGAEKPNVGIQVEPGKDSEQLLQQIAQMEGVEKVNLLDYLTTTAEGQRVTTEFSDDYGKLETHTVYEGRYPQYDNEVVITERLAVRLGKSIGDMLKVEIGNTAHAYLITGLKQSFQAGTNGASLTLAGVRHLIPGHKAMTLNVYLKDGASTPNFIRTAKAEYGDVIQSLTDVDESVKSGTEAYTSAVSSVMVVILAITVLVVILILYLVIRTTILKRKKELGILKATGYTSFQLMTQVALSFAPIVIAGIIAGGVLASLYTNSILELLFADAGITHVHFIIPATLVLTLCFAMTGLAYLVSLFVSRRIKRITAYALITE
ncbi:hypothetical protein GCM10010912_22050 [Paenibacillus albidus]|uniref:ABC3 transporter permease C-terminal domain-containing protein n=1 Tax=Paenibacillus albidus TaxID=2041023 RepID=A0A917FG96_9BACL|nr:ABC transporter permease [Paenibacillus albidus]GGF76545.1 hypothetical protein GCM10010912_22050 [Paenibacillus albidus]